MAKPNWKLLYKEYQNPNMFSQDEALPPAASKPFSVARYALPTFNRASAYRTQFPYLIILGNDSNLLVVDVRNGEAVHQCNIHKEFPESEQDGAIPLRASMSPTNTRWVAIGYSGGQVNILDMEKRCIAFHKIFVDDSPGYDSIYGLVMTRDILLLLRKPHDDGDTPYGPPDSVELYALDNAQQRGWAHRHTYSLGRTARLNGGSCSHVSRCLSNGTVAIFPHMWNLETGAVYMPLLFVRPGSYMIENANCDAIFNGPLSGAFITTRLELYVWSLLSQTCEKFYFKERGQHRVVEHVKFNTRFRGHQVTWSGVSMCPAGKEVVFTRFELAPTNKTTGNTHNATTTSATAFAQVSFDCDIIENCDVLACELTGFRRLSIVTQKGSIISHFTLRY